MHADLTKIIDSSAFPTANADLDRHGDLGLPSEAPSLGETSLADASADTGTIEPVLDSGGRGPLSPMHFLDRVVASNGRTFRFSILLLIGLSTLTGTYWLLKSLALLNLMIGITSAACLIVARRWRIRG